jgi:hypothetical protein
LVDDSKNAESIEIRIVRSSRGVRCRISVEDLDRNRILGGHPSFDPVIPGHWESLKGRVQDGVRRQEGDDFDPARFEKWFEDELRPRIESEVRAAQEADQGAGGKQSSPVDILVDAIRGDESVELWCDRNNPMLGFITIAKAPPVDEDA